MLRYRIKLLCCRLKMLRLQLRMFVFHRRMLRLHVKVMDLHAAAGTKVQKPVQTRNRRTATVVVSGLMTRNGTPTTPTRTLRQNPAVASIVAPIH